MQTFFKTTRIHTVYTFDLQTIMLRVPLVVREGYMLVARTINVKYFNGSSIVYVLCKSGGTPFAQKRPSFFRPSPLFA